MKIKTLILTMHSDETIKTNAAKLRGFFAHQFSQYVLLHQHQGDELIYKYPLVQYKMVDNTPMIVSIAEGTEVLQNIYDKYQSIKIANHTYEIVEKEITIREVQFGLTASNDSNNLNNVKPLNGLNNVKPLNGLNNVKPLNGLNNVKSLNGLNHLEPLNSIRYKFLTPWMALNQKNYQKYKSLTNSNRLKLLEKILIGNILSMSKYLGYSVEEQIKIKGRFFPKVTSLKGVRMLGFVGGFSVNFNLPDFIGLGKSVSRGFGTIKRL